MQKLLLTFAVIFSLNATASAATNFSLFFNDNRGMEETRKMASAIHLNEMAFIQIKRLNDAKFKEQDQAAVKFNTDAPAKEQALNQIEADYAAKISAVLNPVENTAYAEYLKTSKSFIATSK